MARISPDGAKVALQVGDLLVRGTPPAIWVFDQTTGSLSLLTADPAGDDFPVWSSDSKRIYFRSQRNGAPGIYAIDAETQEAAPVRLFATTESGTPWTISPDDKTLALVRVNSVDDIDVTALPLAGGEFQPLLDGGINESEPSISPNGSWIAYLEFSANSAAEINLRPFPAVSRTRVPVGPGLGPLFSRDGSELFYVVDDVLTAVSVEYDNRAPRLGPPQPLFDVAGYIWILAGRRWDIDPSGQRFLLIRRPVGRQAIDVVVNWFEELRRRAPTA